MYFVTNKYLLLSTEIMVKIENFEEYTLMENEEMKDRIAHIIRAKNLTAAEFAIRLGIQPSNVSHLLSGRNNPSLDFVRKLKETFPEYNLDWIIMGKGPMTVSEPFVTNASSVEPRLDEKTDSETKSDVTDGASFANTEHPRFPAEQLPLPSSGLKGMVLVYADNTFEVLSPR